MEQHLLQDFNAPDLSVHLQSLNTPVLLPGDLWDGSLVKSKNSIEICVDSLQLIQFSLIFLLLHYTIVFFLFQMFIILYCSVFLIPCLHVCRNCNSLRSTWQIGQPYISNYMIYILPNSTNSKQFANKMFSKCVLQTKHIKTTHLKSL